jgi:hypothetical protein
MWLQVPRLPRALSHASSGDHPEHLCARLPAEREHADETRAKVEAAFADQLE